MGKKYKVHSNHATTVGVPAKTADGHVVVGQMPCSIIELVPVDPSDHGTVTLREFTPTKEDQKRVAALFVEGKVVEDAGWKESA